MNFKSSFKGKKVRLKSQIFHLHHSFYKDTKKKALSLIEEPSLDLLQYTRNQEHYGRRNFEISSLKTLFTSINRSQVVFLADFHTFEQNARNMQRLIRYFIQHQKNFILGLEMVSAAHQLHLNAFLEKELTMLEFLEAINYSKSWRFPWTHYQGIFDLALTHHFKIIGLNSKGTLSERDNFAAKKLFKTIIENPHIPILVLFGEMHIWPNKLPARLNQEFKNAGLTEPKITIIHQNLDKVYSRLQSENTKNAIVQYEENEFAIQTSYPWPKYESMLYWYESFNEDPEFDVHQYIIEKGMKIFGGSTNYNFLNICQEILHTLKIDFFDEQDLQNFNIYDYTKVKYISDKLERINSATIRNYYQYLFHEGQPFKIPFERKYYSATYSINRLATLVGIHLFELASKHWTNYGEKVLVQRNILNKFYYILHESIISYFCTKFINPHYKCDLYGDLQAKLLDPYLNTGKKTTIQAALEIIETGIIVSRGEEKKFLINSKQSLTNPATVIYNLLSGHSLKSYYEICSIVGPLLSELLFEKLCEYDYEYSINFLTEFLFLAPLDNERFTSIKKILLSDGKYRTKKKRTF